MKDRIYTIGHSTRFIEEFIDILKYYKIECVVDVRRFPKSSKYPHYNRENLESTLEKEGIRYIWLGEYLGGMRKASKYKDKPWGGYLEHMETETFKKGLELLMEEARGSTVAIMCAEKLYFKCHRLMISNKLVKMGFEVIHIVEKNRTYVHKYHPPLLELPGFLQ